MFKSRITFVFALLFSAVFLCAQSTDSYTLAANRRTAVRAFTLAKDALLRKDYEQARALSSSGIEYDAGVSDLWYILAAALKNQGAPTHEVYMRVSTALAVDNWIDYNKDGARILAADILSDTHKYREALDMLAAQPFIYSSDAEFIRAKCNYRLAPVAQAGIRPDANRLRARETVDLAHKIYPGDERYLPLFFQNEILSDYETTVEIRNIARPYVREVMLSDTRDSELVILAAAFAEGEERIRLLRAFQGRGLRHPLFALFALDEGILSQDAAFEYFASCTADIVPRELIEYFASRIDDEQVINKFSAFLSEYSGTVVYDTTGDRIINLTTKYESGRPRNIEFDENQDGIPEWTVLCDYGTPVEVFIPLQNLRVFFGKYPSVTHAVYNEIDFLIPESLVSWSPVDILYSDSLLESPGAYRFFIPKAKQLFEHITERALFSGAAIITTPVPGSEDETIIFSMADGKPLSSDYYKGGQLYARTFFTNGVPASRVIDENADNIFEVTQIFAFDPQNSSDFFSGDEEKKLYESLFGLITAAKGTYLSKVMLDTNADTIADFVEEYTGHGGKSCWWDTNADGNWDIASISYPNSDIEDSLFRVFTGEYPAIVRSEKGVPVSVSRNNKTLTIAKDSRYDFYWIGGAGISDDARLVNEALGEISTHGVVVVEGDVSRIFAVKIGQYRFGEVIHE